MDLPDTPDWRLLRALFPAGEGFRHKMGLQRREFDDFYAPTAAGPTIRREKAAVLDHAFSLYTLASREGTMAFHEFAAALGHADLAASGDDEPGRTASMRELTLRIEPDFLLLMPPGWTLAWASVCFPSHWSLEGKRHRPLPELHEPVPGLNADLGRKITTFFDRMAPGEGWTRANWGLSAATNRNQHPSLPLLPLTATTPPEETFVRIEDQHLLKLPRSGAVAFGIRIASFRLSEIVHEPTVKAGIAAKLRTMPPEIANYKGLTQFLAAPAAS